MRKLLTQFCFLLCGIAAAADLYGEIVAQDRSAKLVLPENYTPAKSYPLVMLLHGFTSNAEQIDRYLGGDSFSSILEYVLVVPEGTKDSMGRAFWNAFPECCNFDNTAIDDSGYLQELITTAKRNYSIDGNRVIVMGHSNGAFMANRLACDAPELISSIVSISGVGPKDSALCQPKDDFPNIIQVHGDNDEVVPYEGNDAFLAAEQSVMRWASFLGCRTRIVYSNAEQTIPGDDGLSIDIANYIDCRADKKLQLWRLNNGSHVPDFGRQFISTIWNQVKN